MRPLARRDLDLAVDAGIITAAQADALTTFLRAETAVTNPIAEAPRFNFVTVLYYLGGMIAIGAMSLFMTLGWNSLGGWGGCVTAVAYAAVALALTHYFLAVKAVPVPAGIMATVAVVMVPLSIFGAQVALGYWDEKTSYRDYHVLIDWRWVMMELGTLAAGAALFWRYRFPFMLMPIAVTLWYASMDLVPYLSGGNHSWELHKLVSVVFGGLMTLLAFWVDVRSRRSQDYAFWLYIFGVLTFWGGLSLMDSGNELARLGYCGINLAMVLIGAVLNRRVFAVFGGLGIAGYLGYVSQRLFKDSLLFPFALSLIGLGIIALGVLWQQRELQWSTRLRQLLPVALRELLETRTHA